jgi:glycosyltransferase involved in cell wall biosynthesis
MEGQAGPREIDDGPTVFSLFAKAKTRTIRFGLQFCAAALDWVGARRDTFDVIHVHSGYADYFMVSGRLKSKVGLPTLHTMYCPIPHRAGRWRLPGVHGMILRWAERLDWRGAISDNVAASMTDYGMESVDRIRPALDLERFSVDHQAIAVRNELGLAANDLVILFVGNAKPQKNAIGVIRAVNKIRRDFPRLKLIITTELKHSSSDRELAMLREEIRNLRMEPFIVQKEIVENMPALMQACDVLVAPFLDSFGPSDYFMAALEAMACGKPVVVSNVGGMPEVISGEVGCLVDPRDDDSIAEGLRTYLADEELRLRTGANARGCVEKHFRPDIIVDAYQSVYRRISK